jgi:hypothetical protein
MATISPNSPISIDSIAAHRPLATELSDRLSQEIVIGLVGPVGSGVSTSAGYIREVLSYTFGYKVCPIITLSKFIKSEAHRVGMAPPAADPLHSYIDGMQTAGNLLREKFGGDYLAEKAVEQIHKFRHDEGGYSGEILLPGRRAYIIDSLKNQEELDLLKSIYGDTLCLFGIFAPDEVRGKD